MEAYKAKIKAVTNLEQILAIAAAPSSKRIEGWRTARYDRVKASLSQMDESPGERGQESRYRDCHAQNAV